MAKKKKDRRPAEEKPTAQTDQAGSGAPPSGVPLGLPHRPGANPGSVDVVRNPPADVHVDPDITEGHPGYEESGASEVIPQDRLSGEKKDDQDSS